MCSNARQDQLKNLEWKSEMLPYFEVFGREGVTIVIVHSSEVM